MKNISLIVLILLFCTSLFGQTFVPKKATKTTKTTNSTYTPEKKDILDVSKIENYWTNEVEFLTITFTDGSRHIPFDFQYQKTTNDNGIVKKFFIHQYCDGTALVIYHPKQNKISFCDGQLLSNGNKEFFHYYW